MGILIGQFVYAYSLTIMHSGMTLNLILNDYP